MSNFPCPYCTSKTEKSETVRPLDQLHAFFLLIRGGALAPSPRNCLSIQCRPLSNNMATLHTLMCKFLFSLRDLAPVPGSIVWNVCLFGWSPEGSGSERLTVKFSHQRTRWMWGDSWSDASTHTYLHTHEGPWGSHALCQVGQTHNSRMHVHISTNRPP